MQINHRINPRNQHEIKQIKAIEIAAQILCEKLGVDITLQAQRQPGWAGADAWHAGMYLYQNKYGETDNTVKINFRNLTGCSTKTVLTVLGHEMRHAMQHQLPGFYESSKWSRKWIGPKHEAIERQSRSGYYRDPCEVDARVYQSIYAELVIADPRFAPFLESLNIEGEVPRKNDMPASYAKNGVKKEETQLFNCDGKIYFLTLSQVGAKKFTPKVCKRCWTEFKDLMLSQPFEYVTVPVTIEDLVS